MSKSEETKTDWHWPTVLFFLLALPLAFEYGGLWIGLFVFVIGSVALGWDKRHDGPFPTNRE